jgi:hypothetical protein
VVLSTAHRLLAVAEQNQAAELAGPGHEQEQEEEQALAEEFGSAT